MLAWHLQQTAQFQRQLHLQKIERGIQFSFRMKAQSLTHMKRAKNSTIYIPGRLDLASVSQDQKLTAMVTQQEKILCAHVR